MLTYEAALKSQDWYSDYSDDIKVWAAGTAAYNDLKDLHRKAIWSIGRKAADALWLQHAPEGFKPPLGISPF